MLEKLKTFLGGDFTPVEHLVVAVVLQLLLTFIFIWLGLLVSISIGTTAGICVFVGREHAQAESKLRKTLGEKAVIEALKFWKWDYPSQMDLYLPAIGNLVIWLLVVLFFII